MERIIYSLFGQHRIVMTGYYVYASWASSLNGDWWDCTGTVVSIHHEYNRWFRIRIALYLGDSLEHCEVLMEL